MVNQHDSNGFELDPVYVHSRREAILIFCVWALSFAWSVPYCYLNGFDAVDPDALHTIWGIPSWVFWGIVCPWLAADAFTVWLCFFYMRDDDLGETESSDGHASQPGASRSVDGEERT